MRTIRKALYVGTFSIMALGMTGCESMQTARNKVASIDFPYFGAPEEKEIAADADGIVMANSEGCPQIAVVDDLKNLTQFEIPSAPTPGTKISHAPHSSRRCITCCCASQWLKSPSTDTCWAFGAQTAKAVPASPPLTQGCAPSFSHGRR